MNVKANLDRADLARFNLYLLPRTRANWISALVLAVFIMGWLVLTRDTPPTANELSVILFSAVAGGFLGIVAGAIFSIAFSLVYASAKDGCLGQHEYEIRPEGLFEKAHVNEGLTKWSGISRVGRSGRFIYVQVNGSMFHVIPKRAFASDAAYESFFHALESSRASAHGRMPPLPAATPAPVERTAPNIDEMMPHGVRTVGVISLLAFLAAGAIVHAGPSEPAAVAPDGGRYYGALVDGKFEGPARMEWDNGQQYEGTFAAGYFSGHGYLQWSSGDRYEGEFRRGSMSGLGTLTSKRGWVYVGQFERNMFNGPGRLRTADGRVYEGFFKDGDYDGRGRLANSEGDVYEGEFQKGEFTGEGTHTTKEGARHEGRFLKWRANGPGRYTDSSGNVYEGTFKNGELSGVVRLTGKAGGSYDGEVRYWRPHGQGVLRLPNGDIYTGAFEDGVYHGKGTLRFAKARPDGSTVESGVWRYGSLPDEKRELQAKENVEVALYNQRALLDKALGAIAPHDPSRINLYFLGVAGDGTQEVFRREIEFVRNQFDGEYGTIGRSVALINSRTTIGSTPLATITSIREALKAIAARMDTSKDILFFYMTSHGSRQHEFTLNQANMWMRGLPAAELGKLLRESGIRYKVVVIGACYSGGFIDAIKDDGTLVITAARHDRKSFGCADENDFTYFGRAFFKESLPTSGSFQEAFRKAEALVGQWEARDLKAGEGTENHSLPQISEARVVTQHLDRWWVQLRGTAASARTFKGGQLGNLHELPHASHPEASSVAARSRSQ